MDSDTPTILSILKKTTDYFMQKGVPEARLSAELLIAHVLNCKRLDLYLKFDQPLTEPQLDQLRGFARRRAHREPLQYILNEAVVGDLHLSVAPGVLIPRPETEELCDSIVSRYPDVKTILDLGTGSGVIAIYLATMLPNARVMAVDKSLEALEIARQNILQHQLESRVTCLQSHWFESVAGTFDLIVSNPPYLTLEEWQSAEPEVRDHEPFEALVPQAKDDDGVSDLDTILESAKTRLNPGGVVVLETGIAQHEHLAALAKQLGYKEWESVKDLSGRPRGFIAYVS